MLLIDDSKKFSIRNLEELINLIKVSRRGHAIEI